MVPGAGIEPARLLGRGILSPVRLPVPPSRHEDRNYRHFGLARQPGSVEFAESKGNRAG